MSEKRTHLSDIPEITLNDGVKIPQIGFGTMDLAPRDNTLQSHEVISVKDIRTNCLNIRTNKNGADTNSVLNLYKNHSEQYFKVFNTLIFNCIGYVLIQY